MRVELRGSAGQAAMLWFEREGEVVKTARGSVIATSPSVLAGVDRVALRQFAGSLLSQAPRYLSYTGAVGSFVFVAPTAGGYLTTVEVTDQLNVLQRALLFYEATLDVTYMRMGLGALVAGANAMRAVITAPGQVGFYSAGFIEQISLEGEELQVDLMHLVAWDRSIEMRPAASPTSSMLRTFTGIAPFVLLSGTGRVWVSSSVTR